MAETLHIAGVQGALKNLGWNQRKLAEAVGVSPQTVTNWLKGQDFPRPAALLKLSRELKLSFDQLVMSEACEPIIAFRRKAATKTTAEHFEKAKNIGYLLRPLVPVLDTLDEAQTVFRTPICDYDNVERLAAGRRAALGISQDAVIDYAQLIKAFRQNGAVLVPVMWGINKRHENALHILLPEENVTFVYVNLDIRVEDFKFMMAHELAHIFTPTLCGTNEGEDFADAFAGALLFPKELAEATHKKCHGKSKNECMGILQGVAAAQRVSLFTVFSQVNAYRLRYGCDVLPVDAKTIHMVRNAASGETVSHSIWGALAPKPELYIDAVRERFDSSFFVALRQLLHSGQGGAGYVQQVLDLSRADAVAIHTALIH